jgi:CheY-like chemotaxis protein/anti-sigma regulatory factor (Ser/Thr protein kinase)
MAGRRTRKPGAGKRSSDQFLAGLSHELRTPLNGVLGMADLLSRTRLDPAQRSYVAALKESGEHLLSLVNDVLDLAKIDAGGFELHEAPVDVERLLQGAAELLSPRAHAKGLEIAWAADRGLPPVLTDEGRLRQILLNLAGNAVKFTSQGGVLITAERCGARLRFKVEDTGPGIAEADQARIFEPFAQGPASSAGQIESTGLGLAIVRRLAAALGGEIGLQSAPGHGACFWFEARLEPAGAPVVDDALAGVTVAVLSPDQIVAEAAARQIKASGGRALVFATPIEAKAAPAGAPILIDYALAGARRLKPPADRPSIVLLTPEQRGRIPALRRAGFGGYLIKPLRRQSLATRVLAVSARVPIHQPQPPAEDERAKTAVAAGARVLLAEDNPINAMLGRALLEREGCAVDRVSTGPEALAAALGQAYDLILLDLRMPGLSGIEAARAMRRKGVTAPIAALTADAFDDTRRACLKAGMDDFLTKPLDPAALRALLGRLMRPGFTESRGDAKLAV